MGWWEISSEDSGVMAAIHRGIAGIESDTPEMYGGDGPADIVGGAKDDLLEQFPNIAKTDFLRFPYRVLSNDGFTHYERPLATAIEGVIKELKEEWNRCWKRDPYLRELEAAFQFAWQIWDDEEEENE